MEKEEKSILGWYRINIPADVCDNFLRIHSNKEFNTMIHANMNGTNLLQLNSFRTSILDSRMTRKAYTDLTFRMFMALLEVSKYTNHTCINDIINIIQEHFHKRIDKTLNKLYHEKNAIR